MNKIYQNLVKNPIDKNLLLQSNHGLETETLRIDKNGEISQNAHPQKLGSKLTNPFITTDFAECQIEMVTSTAQTPKEVLQQLEQIKRFTVKNIEHSELLWPVSMPPKISKENNIKIAHFGHSKKGYNKYLYRKGLAHRYGKKMQTISGIHYNFSFGPDLIKDILKKQKFASSSEFYMKILRNYISKLPFITYLSGNSCVFDKTLLPQNTNFTFQKLFKNTFYAPYATSLRMSEVGYTSQSQKKIQISFKSLQDYVQTLKFATETVHKPYTKITPENQMNVNILQIPNEFYFPVRPKQLVKENENLLTSLEKKGILYIEFRSLDIQTEDLTGLSEDLLNLVHLILIHCIFEENRNYSKNEWDEIFKNLSKVVWEGRNKKLQILQNQTLKNFHQVGTEFIEKLYPTAEILDKISKTTVYSNLITKYLLFWKYPELTPSGKILEEILNKKINFVDWGVEIAKKQKDFLISEKIFSKSIEKKLKKEVINSVKKQKDLEERDEKFKI